MFTDDDLYEVKDTNNNVSNPQFKFMTDNLDLRNKNIITANFEHSFSFNLRVNE